LPRAGAIVLIRESWRGEKQAAVLILTVALCRCGLPGIFPVKTPYSAVLAFFWFTSIKNSVKLSLIFH